MRRLSERERIEILMIVGYLRIRISLSLSLCLYIRIRSHEEACNLFNHEHLERAPIARSTVQRGGRTHVSEETKLDVLLEVQEDPHCSTRQIGLNNKIDHSTV
ncbi:hypothetical protein NQ315_015360 [Exocentrus adspersus]|uniref:Transposase n=1 Tax=Exocentrus adspersus TaxID=1586481 RepID=A0AAV8VK68_9CUCU|nr:hypothetical protein NQ315_015360 [Exocentrus adspersus]